MSTTVEQHLSNARGLLAAVYLERERTHTITHANAAQETALLATITALEATRDALAVAADSRPAAQAVPR